MISELGHDSRKQHACRSVLVALGGFLFCEHHIVHVHGMVWHFVGGGKMFSCKGLLCN